MPDPTNPLAGPQAGLKPGPKGPREADLFVGRRLRARRKELGLSQTRLAEAAGITFQQVQKYEKGTNRVSAGRLAVFAETLKVPVSFFLPRPEGDPGDDLAAFRLDRAATLLAEIVDGPLLTVRDPDNGRDLPLRLGAFREDLAERACELLEELGR